MRLGQADFVLTLLSVFHGALRDRIEDRAVDERSGASQLFPFGDHVAKGIVDRLGGAKV